MDTENQDSQNVANADATGGVSDLSPDACEASVSGATPEPVDPAADAEYWRNTRVMLLDDDQEDSQLIISSLKEIGIRKIIWVKSVSHAYYQLSEDKEVFPNVLVLELVLAGSSGLTLLTRLRCSQDEDLRKLPAVVITNSNNPNIFRRAASQNISAFVRKPVSTSLLRDELVRACTGKTIEMPLDFGRSWIDEVEDTQDQAEVIAPPTFFQRLLSIFSKPKSERINLRV